MPEEQGAGTTRMNISVARELKVRMDAVSDLVNWSACAAKAFQEKLLEIESSQEGVTMDEVIARMKAADELDSQKNYQQGKKAGEEWVKRRARPKQMRCLEKALEEQDAETMLGVASNGYNQGIAYHLYLDINNPGEEYERTDITEFWESVLGDGGEEVIEDYDFALGFIESAMELWEKVSKRL